MNGGLTLSIDDHVGDRSTLDAVNGGPRTSSMEEEKGSYGGKKTAVCGTSSAVGSWSELQVNGHRLTVIPSPRLGPPHPYKHANRYRHEHQADENSIQHRNRRR